MVALLVLTVPACRFALRWGTAGPPTDVLLWSAASGKPVPDNFRYAMFPSPGGSPILDRPNGSQIGTLRRTMLNQQSELSLEFVPVQDGGIKGVVPMSSLRAVCSPQELPPLMDALIREKKPVVGDQWFSCDVSLPPSGSGTVILQLNGDDSHETYTYQINGKSVTPMRIELDTPLSAIASLPRFLVGLCAAAILMATGVIGLILTWFIRR